MAVYNVSTASALQTALTRAVGGDRIVLAAGDYGSILISNRVYASNVTLVSAGRPGSAHIDTLNVRGSSNITFQSLDIGRALDASESIYTNLNSVRSSNNIRMLGVSLHGSKDGNFGNDGQGLVISDSANFRFENGEVSDLTRGIYVERSSNVTFAKNDFHDIRMDGLAVASTSTLYVTGNVFQHFKPQATDHGDAIQLWNTGQTRGSSNILIRDNVIWMPEEQPDGTPGIQGIWIADPGRHGYQNVWIRNNLIYSNDIWNGVSIYGGRNVDVSGNTLLSRPDDGERLWVRLENSVQANVSNNVMEDMIVVGAQPALRNNYNLHKTPSLRALFADLLSPETISDLWVPGIGFQPPAGGLPRLRDAFDTSSELIEFDLDAPIEPAVPNAPADPTEPEEPIAPEPEPAAIFAPVSGPMFNDWFVALA